MTVIDKHVYIPSTSQACPRVEWRFYIDIPVLMSKCSGCCVDIYSTTTTTRLDYCNSLLCSRQ